MKRLLILTIAFSIIFQTLVFARSSSFTDVSGNEYYAEAAQMLWENGIISGYEDGSLRADKSVSRAEMATFVCRLLGEEKIAEGYKGFTSAMAADVPSSHWASGYITYAVIGGIVNGDGNGKFRPDDKVRYAEAIKMIVCAIGLEDKLRPEAKKSVLSLREAGIHVVMITGDSKETACSVAKECGIINRQRTLVLDGEELASKSDEDLSKLLPRLAVISRALP